MTITALSAVPTMSPASFPTVVVVDDHQLLAQSLMLALQFEGITCRVQHPTDRMPLLAELLAEPPDLVLLDLDLGVAGDGAELVSPLVRAGCRVLVVSASTDEDQIVRALENGAVGVVRKDVAFAELLEIALAAARGAEVMSPLERFRRTHAAHMRRAQRDRELTPFHLLSAREAQVLHQLAEGRSVAAIASGWFVSEATVRSQIRAILTKLDVRSQLEAVAKAHQAGWI